MQFGAHAVPMCIGHDCLHEIADRLTELSRHIILVFDCNVYPGRGQVLLKLLQHRRRVSCFFVEADETRKTMRTVERLLNAAVEAGADRESLLVAVGGGLVGNVVGTAANLLFRGVRLAHVPTSLLAMSDSVFSKKQAVNGTRRKNLYGSYLVPTMIGIDTAFLHTLPFAQLSSGFVELCKNGLAIDRSTIPRLLNLAEAIDNAAVWPELVRLGLRVKQHLLLQDPEEKRGGLVLEYGHTTGHAIELANGIPHGHAVGLGMLVACRIARMRGQLSANDEALHRRLLQACGAPLRLPALDTATLLHIMRGDNKRGLRPLKSGQYAFVLLQALGVVQHDQGLPLTVVEEDELTQAISVVTADCEEDVSI